MSVYDTKGGFVMGGYSRRSAIYDVIGERSSETGIDDTSMRLAGTDGKPDWADGDGGSSGVTSDRNAWTAGGEGVRSLRSAIKKAQTRMETEQKENGTGGDADDFECAAVQHSLYTSWNRYLEDVSGRCSVLANLLEKAGDHHYKGDEERRAAFEKLDDKYKDTAAVGGDRTRHGEGGR
ncbi:hypothetical protein [Streptomyces albus]|uniref:hypothetical protein n=1 Tax=Streptomyces albus TaxID=1888 RepID=UPI0033CFC4B2